MIADDAGLAWVLVDAQWRSRFAAQPRYCGSDPSPILQSAAAQADGSAKALISFAVRDEALMGVGGVALNGTIVDFEPWDPTGSPAGSPRLSGSALSVSNVSSTVGVAMLSLSLEGCSSGVLTLNVSTYGCGDCEECDPQVTPHLHLNALPPATPPYPLPPAPPPRLLPASHPLPFDPLCGAQPQDIPIWRTASRYPNLAHSLKISLPLADLAPQIPHYGSLMHGAGRRRSHTRDPSRPRPP